MSHQDPEFEDPDYVSKSQRKRDVEALQDMGAALVKLSADRVKKLDLPDDLRVAVLECQRITSHGALRRQMQYIGKLMRNLDAEPIAEWHVAGHEPLWGATRERALR